MAESPIVRIKKAEEAAEGFFRIAAEIRREAETMEDPAVRREFLRAADGYEANAQELLKILREWRKEIN